MGEEEREEHSKNCRRTEVGNEVAGEARNMSGKDRKKIRDARTHTHPRMNTNPWKRGTPILFDKRL